MKTIIKDWLEYFNFFIGEMVTQTIFVGTSVAVGIAIALTGLGLPVDNAYSVLAGRQTVIIMTILSLAMFFSLIRLAADFAIDRLFPKKEEKKETPQVSADVRA